MAKTIIHHHQHGRPAKPFVLLKKHANNTATLGLEDGTVVVEGCPIGPQSDPHRSYCMFADESAKPKPPTKAELAKAAKELRAKADQLTAAAKAASEAAEAGKEGDQAEKLIAVAIAADEEAKAAVTAAEEAEAASK